MNPYHYINSFIKFGTKGGYKPGLERINALLEPFGHPENKLNIIHVAGSNGKGSTISYLKSIYSEAGYRVGVYSSPHLIEFNERIEINGEKITTDELEEIIVLMKPVIDRIKETELGEPSFFELVTTIAFLYFYQQDVDILLLEVGLGGRLDATNIIRSPLISVITSISLEHTSILGDTVEEIAREKAGIIKSGVPVVTGVRDKKALNEIEFIARKRGSEILKVFDLFDYHIKESSLEGQTFTVFFIGKNPSNSRFSNDGNIDFITEHIKETELDSKTNFSGKKLYEKKELYNQEDLSKEELSKEELSKVEKQEKKVNLAEEVYRISLLGEYQIRNAILAINIVQQLSNRYNIKKSTLKKGLEKAFIPGRMEVLKKEPLLIVDGAHNPDGIAMFVSYVKELINRKKVGEGKIYITLALLSDKDMKKISEELLRLGDINLVISENDSERALSSDILKSEIDNAGINSQVIAPLSKAVEYVLKNAEKDDIICIVGSLYNISEVKKATLSIINVD
ncbi:MAG: bifunctional folylpolyglutamate synthase/dihydrofolate synthase [Halanaerobiales bacterium]